MKLTVNEWNLVLECVEAQERKAKAKFEALDKKRVEEKAAYFTKHPDTYDEWYSTLRCKGLDKRIHDAHSEWCDLRDLLDAMESQSF